MRRRRAGCRSGRRRSCRPTGWRPSLGLDRLWIKDDTRNPSLSFKDRAVAVAAARAVEFGVEALACASTGNLAGATAAAAAAVGLPAYVFIPADLEPAKVDHALAYGATVVPIEGTYDDVNRLCLEVADETGWGFVNINLRPFYAEGSKTLAYEIAESLGWRSPDVIVAPVASGAMFTRVARGFEELAELGLIERRPIRFVGGQAAGCAPVATAWAAGTRRHRAGPRARHDRPLAGHRQPGRRPLRRRARRTRPTGSIEAIEDVITAAAIRDVARLEGIYPETAGGVTLAAAAAARRRGVIRPGDEVVALLTGNGLKTPDARTLGRHGDGVAPARASPGSLRPSGRACRRSSAGSRGRRMSTVRIPPTLRTATGGAKQVEVPGGTVREVVTGLVALHPGLEAQLIAPDGDLNRFVNAFLNDTDVRHLAGARHAGRRGRHAGPAPGDGRRLRARASRSTVEPIRRRVERLGAGRRIAGRPTPPRCRPTGGRAPDRHLQRRARDRHVGHRRRDLDQRFDPAERLGQGEQPRALGDRDRPLRGGPAVCARRGRHERDHPTETRVGTLGDVRPRRAGSRPRPPRWRRAAPSADAASAGRAGRGSSPAARARRPSRSGGSAAARRPPRPR